MLLCENIYVASNFIKLSALEQKLWAFIGSGAMLEANMDLCNMLKVSRWAAKLKSLLSPL